MGKIKIDKIVRSNRKTVALIVTRDAALVVRVPVFTPMGHIERLVSKKSSWIRQKIAEVIKRPKPLAKEFVGGEGFLYLGKLYALRIVNDASSIIEIKADRLSISKDFLPQARQVIVQWYREEALRIIRERCAWYAKITGHKPVSVKITNAQKRWGSCGPRGTLNFSWRLIMAPVEVIDYLVVHELVHIGQPDHSKLFWTKVRSILPDYKKREKWLKENGGLLTV
jgi:hypothetical protein